MTSTAFTRPRRKVSPSENLRAIVLAEIARYGQATNLNHLDVSDVVEMNEVFRELDFYGDISEWDVGNVVSMTYMFANCTFNGDISKWNVRNVWNMQGMFQKSGFSGDLSSWDTSRLKDMSYMFDQSAFEGNVSGWDVQNVQTFYEAFFNCPFDGDISRWRFANLTNISGMFMNTPWRGIPGNLRFRQGMLADGFWEHETANEFAEPNVYHWYLGIHNGVELRPEWKMHLDLLLPGLSENNAFDKANALQLLWVNNKTPQESYVHAFESNIGV